MKKTIFFLCCILCFCSAVQSQSAIKKAECFFDADPGFDKASKISVPANSGNADIDFYARIDSLSAGLHTFCLRTADDSGWSITNCFVMLKQTPQPPKALLVRGEYFFDTDPYFGSAKGAFSLPEATTDSLINLNATIDTLSEGLHVLYLRTRDADSQWSITNNWLLLKQAATEKPDIIKAEYFFDTDPGFGMGDTLSLSASINIIDKDALLNTAGLDSGFHYFFLRTYDGNGNWSITNYDTLTYKGNGVLPLAWLNFSAVQQGKNGWLTWQTADEINTSYFEIQHSTNGRDWTTGGTAKAIGQAQNSYSFSYKNLQPGNNFFRLKQMDINGKYTYSVTRNIYYVPSESSHIKVTPNPVTTGKIWLTGDVFTKNKTVVSVTGSNGIRYQQQEFDVQTGNTVPVVLNRYIGKGMYFIEVESISGRQIVSLIVQ